MKAMYVREAGFPGELCYEDAPNPLVSDGMVLIRVAPLVSTTAIPRPTWRVPRQSRIPDHPWHGGRRVVEAVGPGYQIETLRCGAGLRGACLCRAGGRPAVTVLPMPVQLGFDQAAAIPVAFGTAWHALTTLAHVQPCERVLVHAAGSGVGSAAIPLAKHLGAWVIATAGRRPWKLDRALELGADAVCDDQSVAGEITRLTHGQGVDVVLEGVGKATFGASLRSMAEGGAW